MSAKDFESFVKCFAGVYRKHAKGCDSSRYTCYVRQSVSAYTMAAPDVRMRMIGGANREDLIGYRIAIALENQGFGRVAVRMFVSKMQDVIDETERRGRDGFTDVLEQHYGGNFELDGWANEANCMRYMHMMEGCEVIGDDRYDDDDNDDDNDD